MLHDQLSSKTMPDRGSCFPMKGLFRFPLLALHECVDQCDGAEVTRQEVIVKARAEPVGKP